MSDQKPKSYKRLCERYAYTTKAEVMFSSNLSITVDVDEVSKTGIKILSNTNVPTGIIDIKFRTQSGEWLELQCERVWEKQGCIGFRIWGNHEPWNTFISELAKTTQPLPYVA
jgi:hypothetical protein